MAYHPPRALSTLSLSGESDVSIFYGLTIEVRQVPVTFRMDFELAFSALLPLLWGCCALCRLFFFSLFFSIFVFSLPRPTASNHPHFHPIISNRDHPPSIFSYAIFNRKYAFFSFRFSSAGSRPAGQLVSDSCSPGPVYVFHDIPVAIRTFLPRSALYLFFPFPLFFPLSIRPS